MTDLVHASQNSYSFSVVSCHKEHISDLLLPSLRIYDYIYSLPAVLVEAKSFC